MRSSLNNLLNCRWTYFKSMPELSSNDREYTHSLSISLCPAYKTHTLIGYKAIAVPAFCLHLEIDCNANIFKVLQAIDRVGCEA